MNGIFEHRTSNSYTKIDYNVYLEMSKERERRGIVGKWDFSGCGSKVRTYDKIPNHKFFNFLRKAFEECPWVNIKKFTRKDDPNKTEYHVDCVYWDYMLCGYVLMVLYHNHIDNDPNRESHGLVVVKDINCVEPIDYVFDINCIEIVE